MSCRYCLYFITRKNYKTGEYDDYLCSHFGFQVSPGGRCNEYVNKEEHYAAIDRENRRKAEKQGYKDGFCFLTSACTDFMGKPDDCEELTILRAFRDEHVKQTQNGQELINEYYRIAPDIVKKINSSPERDKYYQYIYSVIIKCLSLINSNDNDLALLEYKKMVEILQNKLLS